MLGDCTEYGLSQERACRPCARATLVFSVLLQFLCKLLKWAPSHFLFMDHADVILKKSLPNSRSQRLSPILSPGNTVFLLEVR